jgi:predicted Zn-dependent protease
LRTFQNFKDNQNAAIVASLLISAIAIGAQANAGSYSSYQDIGNIAGILSDIVYLGSIAAYFGYSREMESYADIYGHTYATTAGYDGEAGANIWQNQIKETLASDYEKVRRSPTRINIFGSHPIESKRVSTLEIYNKNVITPESKASEAIKKGARLRYRDRIRPYLSQWLKDDLRRQDFGQTLHIIDRLSVDKMDMGVIYFFRGEALKLRHKEKSGQKDLDDALLAYKESLTHPDAPMTGHRQMGEIYRKLGKKDDAIEAFRAYLKSIPEADDAWIVEDMIATLEKPETLPLTTEIKQNSKKAS